ncbi:MAG: hypothetical protein QOF53_1601 [Nocardioidaceae bacterium]|nr:hypothetical protein [Nocardioidaceae bacterium]
MIDFRYHIVSIIAVFLALSLGLFLGSTTLQSTVTHNLQAQAHTVTARNQTLRAANDRLSTVARDQRAFLAGIAPYAAQNRLSGASAALVSAPGVSSDYVAAMGTVLAQAGATVTATVQLQSAYFDPTQDAELGGLATQLKLPGHPLPVGSGSTESSAELAAVLTARPGRKAVAKTDVEAVLSALADGKFITVDGDPPTHAATLAVLLVPAPSATTSLQTAQTQNAVLLALANQLRKTTTGLVVGGQTADPTVANGMLAAVEADAGLRKAVSTVDFGSSEADPDQTAGRIAVVLALAATPSGKPGSYGLGGSPPVPSASTSP